jgi:repressor LexA
MTGPTLRQREVLRAIKTHQAKHGFPISIRELGTALGISSTNAVADHLRALEAKGLVNRENRRSRTLTLTNAGLNEVAHG